MDVKEHAAELLRKERITVLRVIDVQTDCILYLSPLGARTAFLSVNEHGKVTVTTRKGFPAYV